MSRGILSFSFLGLIKFGGFCLGDFVTGKFFSGGFCRSGIFSWGLLSQGIFVIDPVEIVICHSPFGSFLLLRAIWFGGDFKVRVE